MAHKLIYYGSDALKKVAEEVKNIDSELAGIADSMFNIMYREKGIGLAAPQIAVSKRLITLDISDYEKVPPLVIINPEIIERSEGTEPYEEGCLSVPGITGDVLRPSEILIRALDINGREIRIEADGLLARVLQHEIDHINGILFIDRLEEYKQKELRAELKMIKKLNRIE